MLLLELMLIKSCYGFLISMSDTLPTGQLSNVPWRRTGVKYTNNEAYFDVVEEIDVIIDKSGATVFAEIQGYVCHSFFCLHVVFYIFLLLHDQCVVFPWALRAIMWHSFTSLGQWMLLNVLQSVVCCSGDCCSISILVTIVNFFWATFCIQVCL